MNISAIQNQPIGSTKGLNTKKSSHSVNLKKDLTSDSFSKEKSNNVAFGSGNKWILLGIVTTLATGGLALIPAAFIGIGLTKKILNEDSKQNK